VSLEDELALARRYVEIERLRFGERLRVCWQVPDALPPVQVPTLSVQPLVENAIRHGIERAPGGGEIHVEVVFEAGDVRIDIRNPLPPADAGAAARGHQVGLSSVRARVQAMSGGRGSVDTRVAQGQHVATLRLPLPA